MASTDIYHTDPYDPDSDDDISGDYYEVKVWGTDPWDPDTDDDGYGDWMDMQMNYDGQGHPKSKDLYIEVDKDVDITYWPGSSFWNEIKSDFLAIGIYAHIVKDQANLDIPNSVTVQWCVDRSGDGCDPWANPTYKELYFVHIILVDSITDPPAYGFGSAKASDPPGQRSGTAWFARGQMSRDGWGQISQADVFSHELGHLLNLIHTGDQYDIMYGSATQADRYWISNPDVRGRFPEKWMAPGYVLIG